MKKLSAVKLVKDIFKTEYFEHIYPKKCEIKTMN